MKLRIKYLPQALENREQIKAYLSQFYPSTPKKFFSLLKRKTGVLKDFPYSCPVYEHNPNYRVLILGDYLLFYVVKEHDNIIEIHRILHGSRDIANVMKR